VTGQRIGYIRVSTLTQNADRQLDGIELHKVFEDKASGRDRDRPKLRALLDHVRDGDTVFVHSMDRLARNVDDLRTLVATMTAQGVEVRIAKEFGISRDTVYQYLRQVDGTRPSSER